MGLASDLYNDPAQQAEAATAPELETPALQPTAADLFGSPEAQTEDRLKFVMDETIDEAPDRAARALELQNKTGIPKKFIDDNFDELDKAARQADFNSREFMKSSPKVADWLLRNPDYAPLLREDIDSIGGLESLLKGPAKFFTSGESWGDVFAKRTESAGQALNVQFAGLQQATAIARNAPGEFLESLAPKLSIQSQFLRSAAKGVSYLVAPDWALTPEQRKRRDEAVKRFGADYEFSPQAVEKIAKDPLFIEGMDRAAYHIERMGELQPQVPEWSSKDLIGSAYESLLTSVLPMIATGRLGGVVTGTATFSTQVYTQNLAESLNEGMPLSKAHEYASWKILSEGIPESLPLSVAMKAGRGFWSKTLAVALTESAEEGLTEMADIAYETLKLDEDIGFKDAVNRVFKAMTVGSLTGAGMGSVAGINDVVANRKAKQSAQLQEDFFKALGENATASKLREKLPESYQSVIAEITKDGPVENVYAPVEFFQSHFRENGIDPLTLAKEMGIERQYTEAVNTGGKIAIPTDVYAAKLAATEHNAAFGKELSFAPDQMNARETEEFIKAAQERTPLEPDTFEESVATVMAPIREQMAAIYPADQVNQYATVLESRIRTRSQRLGIDPQELMKRRPLSITEGGTSGGVELSQKIKPPKKLYRGVAKGKQESGEEGTGVYSMGKGIYSSADRSFAAKYGDVIELDPAEAFPKNPLVLKNVAGGAPGALMDWALKESGMKNAREFNKKYPDPGVFVREKGYDGVIAGDEIVKYTEEQSPELYQAQKQTETLEFKKWFKDSKVVDESGKPLVVYHGTTSGDVTQFDAARRGENTGAESSGMGFFFTDDTVTAESYANYAATDARIAALVREADEAEKRGDWDAYDAKVVEYETLDSSFNDPQNRLAGQNTLPVYVRLTNPLRIDAKGENAAGFDIAAAVKKAVKGKHDGLIIDNLDDAAGLVDRPAKHYVAFEPTQIKSAIGNRGTFDPNDPNILRQGLPEQDSVTRGAISITDQGDIIRLFESRNLSTLLHESAHRWLFELQDDAAMPDAPQSIKDDLAKAIKYLGIESAEQLDILRFEKGTKEYERAVEANEKWARSGEAYLKEGKAPSTELRSVFARFKAWLVAVYDALKQGRLDVNLTDEIRGVFDRLLATDQQIAAAKAQAVPIFTTAVDAGMTDTEFAAYRKTVEDAGIQAQEEIDAKIMAEYKRTLTDVWKEEKAKVREEVEAEADKIPIYAAIRKAQENGIVMNRDAAKAMGKEVYKRLPKNLTAENGIPLDMAAELLGFPSGDVLVRSIAGAEKREAYIARETDVRMNERFGNMLTDGTIVEEARKALANDMRAKVITAEIKALNKKAREVAPFVKAKDKAEAEAEMAGRQLYAGLVPKLADVREHARQVIAAKPVRELRPMQHFNTARQASRQAVESVRKGDFLMAAFHKGRELLNLELYREAVSARDMVDESLDKLNKAFVSDIKQSKTRNMDMVNAARAILASHGIGRSEESPASYLEKVRQYDAETYENLRPLFEHALATMKPYKEMTVEEFIGMRDSVLALMQQSRRSKQISVDGKLMDREQVVTELVDSMAKFKKKDVAAYNRTRTKWEKTQAGMMGARAILRRVEHWVDAMDGGNPDGVFRKYLVNPVMDAINEYRDAKRVKLMEYLGLVKQIENTMTRDKIDAPELEFQFNGKIELLHAILHTGNESNLRKLLLGYKWATLNEDGTMDTSRWDAFVNRMQDEGVLTKADYDFTQGVWDMMESMKPKAQAAHHRMYGYYFSEITANEFTNRYGTYKGGYVPAIVDQDVVTDAAIRKDKDELLHGQNSFAFPTTGRGATMKRLDSYAKPLQLDMRTIPAHIDWAMRFAYIEPAVKDVGRIVINKDFRAVLDGLDPAAARHMLMPWLQRAAKQQTSTPGMLPWMDRVWREIRSRSGMQIMVVNVINTLQQFTGLSMAMTKVKAGSMRTALWQYLTNHKEMSEAIAEKSAFMRNRVFTSHVEIQKTIDDLLLNPTKYEKAREFALAHGYFMQQGTQSIVDKISWTAAYNEAIENGMDENEAVRHADSVVRETQGSFAAEDISRFEAGTPFMRAFSMFYNYFNMQANLLGTEFRNIATNKLGLRKGAGRALHLYVFGFLIPAYVGDTLIRALISGMPDDDDDDGYLDEFLASFFDSQIRAVTAMVPIAGPAVMAGINAWNDKWYDDRITTSPAVSMIESAVRSPYTVYKAISDDGSQKRAVQDTLTAIGLFTGLPAGALSRPLGYLADVNQGRAEPESTLDVVRGLVSGKDVNREQ